MSRVYATVTKHGEGDFTAYAFDCTEDYFMETITGGVTRRHAIAQLKQQHPDVAFYSPKEYKEYKENFQRILFDKTIKAQRITPTQVIHKRNTDDFMETTIGALSFRYELEADSIRLHYAFTPYTVFPFTTEFKQTALRKTADYLKQVLSVIEKELGNQS